MQGNDRLEKLRGHIDKAVSEYEQARSHLDNADKTIGAGDVIFFSSGSLVCVVIFPHPDQPSLWYLVPADQNPMVGAADVEVPATVGSGPLTLRCGRGTWIGESALDSSNRVGQIEPGHVELARDKLSQIAGGGLTPSRHQQELDWNPDYQEWLDHVAEAVETLEASLLTGGDPPAVVVAIDEFGPDWSSRMRHPVQTPVALAAESGDPLADLSPDQLPDGTIIDLGLPGELVVLNDPDGIILQYFPGDDETAPEVCWHDADGNPVQATWQQTPNGVMACFDPVPWTDRTSEFVVAERTVTIQR